MKDLTSAIVVGILMSVFAFLGLFLWARAADGGMAVFGAGLLVFGVAADFFLISWYYDSLEAHARVGQLEGSRSTQHEGTPAMAEAAE